MLYCYEDDTVESVAKNMANNQVRRLPVLTREKRLCGIVALGDLAVKGVDEPAEEALEGISRQSRYSAFCLASAASTACNPSR